MTPANKNSWRILPLPERRVPLGLSAVFTDAGAERIRRGHIPRSMDDKWFIYFEDGWLYMHRSWSGACVFALRLDGSPAGVRVIDSWVNGGEGHHRSAGIEQDRELALNVIQSTFSEDEVVG